LELWEENVSVEVESIINTLSFKNNKKANE
jgi:hypothetical protein